MKIRSCVKWSLRRGEKQRKNIMPSPQKVMTVAYERWSFTRGSNYRALTGKNLVFWIGGHYRWLGYERWSLTRDGRTWRFDCIINTKITCLIAYLPMKAILLVKSFFAPFSLVQTRFSKRFLYASKWIEEIDIFDHFHFSQHPHQTLLTNLLAKAWVQSFQNGGQNKLLDF